MKIYMILKMNKIPVPHIAFAKRSQKFFMNQKLTYFYFVFIAISFLQCTQPKRAMSNKDGHLIENLVIFPIYSKIDIIENQDKRITSEIFSSDAEIKIKNQLEKYIPSNINKNFLAGQIELEEQIIKSNVQLIKTYKGAIFQKTVEVPEFLLNILDSLGKDYSLFIFHRGFTRTPENLKTQYIKRRTAALASLGFYDTEPNSAYSVMIGVLIDKKRKRISMYKELYWRNRNPNEEVVIRSQIRDLILGYFQNSK